MDEPIQENYEKFENAVEFTALNPKIKVKYIDFDGLKRTNRTFLLETLSDSSIGESKNLKELSERLSEAFRRLERLDIFKTVSVTIDQAGESAENRELNGEDAAHEVKVVFNCKEKKFNIRTGTELQRKDIAWNFGGKFFNLFGRAESLEINSSIGANSSMPFNMNFLKPLNGNSDKIFFVNCAKFKDNFLNHCKWRQEVQSISTGFQFQDSKLEGAGSHEIKYLCDLRRLFDVQSGASHVIRNQAGKSIKSSLIHTWTLSNRNSSVFPNYGHLIRISSELAGLGGDFKFIKSDLTLQNNWTRNIFTLTKTLKIGFSVPLSRTNQQIPIFDRFQMGGPTSLRGFHVNSLGPRQFNDSLGGTCLLETGLQLSFPFIKSASNFARAHLFLNSGILSDAKEITSCINSNGSLKEINANVSLGAGLMFKMAESARLELNFAVPILCQKGVESSRGIQIGIGMEFL